MFSMERRTVNLKRTYKLHEIQAYLQKLKICQTGKETINGQKDRRPEIKFIFQLSFKL